MRGVESPAVARSQVYQLLARSFAYPDQALWEDVTQGRWQEQVSQVLPQLPFELTVGGAAVAFPFAPLRAGSFDEFQAEYNRLFEVGAMGGPPCPLFGGHHERHRLRVMEELIRFYNYFGLSMAAGQLPDHITVELEFMHYLTFKEAAARRQDREQDSYQRAQKDFLDRHLGKWVPVLRHKLFNIDPAPFFAQLVAFTDELVGRDRQYLKSILNPSPSSL